MKLKLRATSGNVSLYEGTYDVSDARSFGDACADMWSNLAQRNLAAASSVGAVYEALGDNAIPDLRTIEFRFERLDL